jgi:hypothetical protein
MLPEAALRGMKAAVRAVRAFPLARITVPHHRCEDDLFLRYRVSTVAVFAEGVDIVERLCAFCTHPLASRSIELVGPPRPVAADALIIRHGAKNKTKLFTRENLQLIICRFDS